MMNIVFTTGARLLGIYESEKREMMNGNYGGGWMGGGWMGGGWIMIIGVLVCLAIIGAVVWLVMRSLKNRQLTHLSSLPQPHAPSQMNGQGYQSPPQQTSETYQEGGKQYSYPQSSQQQERPLN
jgi:predicted lipid-binding transport protein (Tim44 family)